MTLIPDMKDNQKTILNFLLNIVDEILNIYSETLIKMAMDHTKREIPNNYHKDNFLSEIDLEINQFYQIKIAQSLRQFVYISEENEPKIYPLGSKILPELAIIVDPLDTSELAVRGLNGYTHLLVYSLVKQVPILSIVGDFFHNVKLYFAFKNSDGVDNAFLMTRNEKVYPLGCSNEEELSKALITTYSMRPVDRFLKFSNQRKLLNALAKPNDRMEEKGRIGLDFGSVGLCHVAAGFSDAMVETAKGFLLWDLLPGQYILKSSGGYISDLSGIELPLNLQFDSLSDIITTMEKRQKFIATGNLNLLHGIRKNLNRS
jgi:myo-inositol-1(or 4)-monophosphatase